MPAANPPKVAPLKSVCDSQFRTFTAAELPLSQRHLHGSTAWRKSYARRNEVERLFSNTKDQASENLRRGSIRVRGIVKMGLFVALSLASTNVVWQELRTASARATEAWSGTSSQALGRRHG